MSRFNSSGYGHDCNKFGVDWYRISWTFDRYYANSRLRFPHTMDRDTDEKGARRFCKKWDIDFEMVEQDYAARKAQAAERFERSKA